MTYDYESSTMDIEDLDQSLEEVVKHQPVVVDPPKNKIKIVLKHPMTSVVSNVPSASSSSSSDNPPGWGCLTPQTFGTSIPQKMVKSQIISASRRTDIPAFYMDLFVESMKKGYIEVVSPYGQKSVVSLSSHDVKCIVWWSKNFNQWIRTYQTNLSLFTSYQHVFNFTLTGPMT